MCMRLHITLGEGLVIEVDKLAGPRGRSEFIREAIEREVERRRSREALLRIVGAAPDFASHLPPDWIRREREQATAASDRKLREAGWLRD